MADQWEKWAEEAFNSSGREFGAALVHEDGRFFIMDWRDKNGSETLAVRYILDKRKGDLAITGDAGCCIAGWQGPVSVEDIAGCLNDPERFIEAIQCTTNKYTYDWEDVVEDLEAEKEACLKNLCDGGAWVEDLEELGEDFQRMETLLTYTGLGESCMYPEELVALMMKYDPDWWDGPFAMLGRRIDKMVYLWAYGFQEGVRMLRAKKFVSITS